LKNPASETGAKSIEAQNHLEKARQNLLKKHPIMRKDVDLDDLKKNKDQHMEFINRKERRAWS
jgi:hypothetical protein